MSDANVRSALTQAFVNGAFFSSSNVAWENKKFDPPANPWARFTYIPNQPEVATLGDEGQDELTGILQIDLNYPQDNGLKDVSDKYESIRTIFAPGNIFTHAGQWVRISSCGRSHGRIVDNYYRVTITIMFYAYINR